MHSMFAPSPVARISAISARVISQCSSGQFLELFCLNVSVMFGIIPPSSPLLFGLKGRTVMSTPESASSASAMHHFAAPCNKKNFAVEREMRHVTGTSDVTQNGGSAAGENCCTENRTGQRITPENSGLTAGPPSTQRRQEKLECNLRNLRQSSQPRKWI